MSVLDTLRGKYPKMLSVLELQQFSRVLAARFVEFDRTGTLALALPVLELLPQWDGVALLL